MSGPDDDLHDPKLSELYRQLPDATPSAETDDRIRAAARRAVAAGPRPLSRTRQLQRITAVAAALLLGIGLTVQWQLRSPREFEAAVHPTSAPPQSPPPPAAEAPAPAPATAAQQESHQENRMVARANKAPRRADTLTAVPASPSVASAGGAPAEEASLAEDRLADASPAPALAPPAATGGIAPAAEKEQALAKALADRRDATGALRREKKAEAAAVAAEAAAPDYRELMRQRRYAQALATLPQAQATQLDRDLLQRLLGRSTAPACGSLTAEAAPEALLCTFLQRQAQGRPLPADWLLQLERAGAFTEEKQYRRPAVLELFSAPAARD